MYCNNRHDSSRHVALSCYSRRVLHDCAVQCRYQHENYPVEVLSCFVCNDRHESISALTCQMSVCSNQHESTSALTCSFSRNDRHENISASTCQMDTDLTFPYPLANEGLLSDTGFWELGCEGVYYRTPSCTDSANPGRSTLLIRRVGASRIRRKDEEIEIQCMAPSFPESRPDLPRAQAMTRRCCSLALRDGLASLLRATPLWLDPLVRSPGPARLPVLLPTRRAVTGHRLAEPQIEEARWPTPLSYCFWLFLLRGANLSVTGRGTEEEH